jgi:hypothetical protein
VGLALSHRFFAVTHTLSSTISWEYVPLKDIEITPGLVRQQARLLCEDDEGGWMSTVVCDDHYLFYLAPYQRLLSDWLDDASSVERPVIPIERSAGRLYFSLAGAEHDYPELRLERARRLTASFMALSKAVTKLG